MAAPKTKRPIKRPVSKTYRFTTETIAQLNFLGGKLGLTHTAAIERAVADMAKQVGYKPTPEIFSEGG